MVLMFVTHAQETCTRNFHFLHAVLGKLFSCTNFAHRTECSSIKIIFS